jgi:hypothetical protein
MRPDVYQQLLEIERSHAATWPRHDDALLSQLEAGLPVVVWGDLVDSTSPAVSVTRVGNVTPLPLDDPRVRALMGGSHG